MAVIVGTLGETMTDRTAPRPRRPFQTGLGAALVLAGVVANVWTVGVVFSPDGSIDSTALRALIWAFDGAAVLLGIAVIRARSSLARKLRLLLMASILGLVLLEGGLRLLGFAPWRPPDLDIRVEPGGKFFQAHPTLGYRHLPGAFSVTLPDGYSFRVTHGEDTLRVMRPAGASLPPAGAPGIWIFGCSFTHGWTVNDAEDWPSRVQEALPGHDVVNFGADGYGTLQSFIQFREALETRSPPRAAIVAYASFHDPRNTFVRHRRKDVAPVNRLGPLRQPFARLRDDGTLVQGMAEVGYREFPLMRQSALVHLLEVAWNGIEESTQGRSQEVTRRLFSEWAAVARGRGVALGVAGILDDALTKSLGAWCEAADLPFADISVDLEVPENTNLPHDNHPSARAHAAFAERALPLIRRLLER